MPTLGIDLQSGFDDDEVVIRINGEERLHRDNVKTRRVLGLADHARFELEKGLITVDVEVPGRAIARHLEIDLDADTWLGFSLENDDVRVIVNDERFGYG